jgi:uncharacterized protein
VLDWAQGELAEGVRCYRAGGFFAAHEHWEVVWLQLNNPEKEFLQGVIQMAAACHHLQRGNLAGAHSLLRRALQRFEPHGDHFAGLQLATMRGEIRDCLAALETADARSPLTSLPQIQLIE